MSINKECEFLEGCPVFGQFMKQSLKLIWILKYCKGPRLSECARLIAREQGRVPAGNLLPNGELMDFPDQGKK